VAGQVDFAKVQSRENFGLPSASIVFNHVGTLPFSWITPWSFAEPMIGSPAMASNPDAPAIPRTPEVSRGILANAGRASPGGICWRHRLTGGEASRDCAVKADCDPNAAALPVDWQFIGRAGGEAMLKAKDIHVNHLGLGAGCDCKRVGKVLCKFGGQ
jgi:hypothetical protein